MNAVDVVVLVFQKVIVIVGVTNQIVMVHAVDITKLMSVEYVTVLESDTILDTVIVITTLKIVMVPVMELQLETFVVSVMVVVFQKVIVIAMVTKKIVNKNVEEELFLMNVVSAEEKVLDGISENVIAEEELWIAMVSVVAVVVMITAVSAEEKVSELI